MADSLEYLERKKNPGWKEAPESGFYWYDQLKSSLTDLETTVKIMWAKDLLGFQALSLSIQESNPLGF